MLVSKKKSWRELTLHDFAVVTFPIEIFCFQIVNVTLVVLVSMILQEINIFPDVCERVAQGIKRKHFPFFCCHSSKKIDNLKGE